ncbi:NAD(P)/FAD-dependent oxidoreductase [Palleronia sediminis]|nr:FAD-dependent oxidoreductase [Palleronia sediminis]
MSRTAGPRSSTTQPRVVVIGAGAAGLSAAADLRAAGIAPVVIEKSRGIGGRLATRRRDGAQFDHGAPSVSAVSEDGAAWLDAAMQSGHATEWAAAGDTAGPQHVGLPGASGLCRGLAEGLDIRFSTEVATARRKDGLWRLGTSAGDLVAEMVIAAIPAPQADRLFGHLDRVSTELAGVTMAPAWTLMVQFEAAFDAPPPDPAPSGVFSAILCDSAKPGRDAPGCWVAHATAPFSRAHLERDRDEMAGMLVAALAEAMGPLPPTRLAMAHRWRFARTDTAAGLPVLAYPDDALFLAGDWTLGALADHAVQSGRAAARAALSVMSGG